MKSKIDFSLKFIGLNGLVLGVLSLFQYADLLKLTPEKFSFIIVISLTVLLFSLFIIIPAIEGRKDAMVFQFMMLTTLQLLLMLGFIIFEIYQWKTDLIYPIFIQLIPFISLIIFQTVLLFNYNKNQ
jgi:hypothetical protein